MSNLNRGDYLRAVPGSEAELIACEILEGEVERAIQYADTPDDVERALRAAPNASKFEALAAAKVNALHG